MTFIRLAFFPEGTAEDYAAVADAMGVTEAPEGRLLFTAGAARDGWQVVQVWRTRQGLERVNRTMFLPALAAMSAPGFPRPPEVTDFEAEVLSLGS